jgi:two-component system, OmpR family, sensor kinase
VKVIVSAQRDSCPLRARLWASRWPEAAWTVFAVVNLAWMVLVPSQSLLPFHFIWISLLLLYGLGYRTYTRRLTWFLLVPVMAGAALLFIDARIRALQPYDELIELPVMVVMLFAITRHTSRRAAAIAALDKVSQHNEMLLGRQRTFVQNASHELRTPITVALAHAELLPRPGADPAVAEDLDIITDELARLRRLTDRLLLLATAEEPDRLHPVPTRLTDILDDALRRWEPVPRKWVAGHHDDTAVLADPDRLVVALDAILDNAVRFTREGDRIELSAHRDGQRAGITVADSGPGIPDSQLGSVFDRFNTASPHRDTARNFGLGLSIVRAIAEAHAGQVAASPSPFGGAAVTLWLPQHDLPLSPALPAEHAER